MGSTNPSTYVLNNNINNIDTIIKSINKYVNMYDYYLNIGILCSRSDVDHIYDIINKDDVAPRISIKKHSISDLNPDYKINVVVFDGSADYNVFHIVHVSVSSYFTISSCPLLILCISIIFLNIFLA